MFVGRKKELENLENIFLKDQSGLYILYGHKGVGKTTLCLRFAANKAKNYYCARDCSREEQIFMWSRELGISSDSELSFLNIFSSLKFDKEGKKVLIIDEFQNILKNADDFFIDLMRYIKESDEKIMVLLCSSSISFVENNLVPKIGNLSLGINGFIKISDLKFADIASYFKKYDTKQLMEVYSLLGGTPYYWEFFKDSLSVEENIKNAILKNTGFLKEEGLRIVSEELRELNVYCTILYCLANGMNKLNELHEHTGYSRAKISVYIKNLMERELVEKVFSFDNASSVNTKKGVYRIANRLLHFYFRFIFNNLSFLELLGADDFYASFVSPGLPAYHQDNFKFVCSEYMEILNQKGKLPIQANKSGEWVGKNGSIDLVMQNEDWDNLLCFCNWDKEIFTKADYDRCLQIAADARLKPDYLLIFSKGQFENELVELENNSDNISLVDIKML